MRSKPITRRTVLSLRDKMPEAVRIAASDAIAVSVASLIANLPAGALVGMYAPKGTEVETVRIDAAVRARGLRVAYPRIVAGDRRLAFHEVTPAELQLARFGLREPRADARTVDVSTIAAFVIPGLAFDTAGGRIGWGRGYYDATLAIASPTALRIGLGFDCQLVDSVPRDAHDAQLHYVVTETTVHRGAPT
jgi:5-formyltetrahydrofolate cyclo-ligase